MGNSRWKPLPADLPSPARDLAERLRAVLDDNGMSLRQLAAAEDVHYSVTTLHRLFSGQALPPRQLIEVVVRRCGGDLEQLGGLYERAREVNGATELEALPAAGSQLPDEREQATAGGVSRRRHWLVVAIVTAVLGSAAAIGITVALGADTSAPPGYELVVNGSFESFGDQGFTKWWSREAGVRSEGGTARIEVPGGTKLRWDVLLGQSGMLINSGKEYTLSFTASAEKVATMGVTVQEERRPDFPQVYFKNVPLGPAPESFVLHFPSKLDTPAGQLVFQFGGQAEDFVAFLDNVSLVEHAE